MTARFVGAENNDKVYDRVYGMGSIIADKPVYPSGVVEVSFDGVIKYFSTSGELCKRRCTHTAKCSCGVYIKIGAEPTLFYVDGDNKYAINRPKLKVPWDKVPVDTKLEVVYSGCVDTSNRYYSHNCRFFTGGTTSWSSSNPHASTTPFSNARAVRLAEAITIDGVTYPEGSE